MDRRVNQPASPDSNIYQFPTRAGASFINEREVAKSQLSPSINQDSIARLRTDLGDSFGSVIRSYIKSLTEASDQARAAMDARNYGRLLDVVSGLETSSLNVGAEKLAASASGIRKFLLSKGHKSDPSRVDWLLFEMLFEYGRVKEYLSSDLLLSPGKPEPKQALFAGAKVLLVESDDTTAGILTSVMMGDGLEVIRATNRSEAISLSKTSDPVAYVIDAFISGGSGVALCDEIHRARCTSPILVITEYDDHETVKSAIDCGASDFIPKPVYIPVFRQRMRYLCGAEISRREIEYLATHDILTGLPNRALFTDRLNMEIERAKRSESRLAVMYIDLDRFKQVNDSLGHQAGDDVLRQASDRMRGCLRDVDTLARIGGDEFVAILPGINANTASATIPAMRILEEVSKPFFVSGSRAEIGSSIGIALYPDHGKTGDEVLSSADGIMYKVKENGRNSYLVCD